MEVPGRITDDQHGGKNSGLGNILCQPCHNDGDEEEPVGYCETCNEHLCSVCLKVHRKQSATKNHVLKSKDDMPRVQVRTDQCSELCTTHKMEIVKFYCQDHDDVGCGDCMVLEHKVCKVKLVSDVSGSYARSGEPEQIKIKIEQLLKDISRSKQEVDANTENAAEMNMKVVKEIKEFRSKLNSYLDRVEAELLREAEQLRKQNDATHRKVKAEYTSMEEKMKELGISLERNSDKINNLFVTVKNVQKRLRMFQNLYKSTGSEGDIRMYKFKQSKELMALIDNKTPIGTISDMEEKIRMVDTRAKFERKLNVQAKSENECRITGMAMLSSDEILLADYKNTRLKVLNIRENKIVSRFSTLKHDKPWDVTVINSNTAAATIPANGEILFIYTLDGLSESHSLKVRNGCRGINHHNGVLAVSFCFPHVVQLLDIDGNLLHKVSDTSMFEYPGHLVMSGESIFLSDYWKGEVFQISLDCKLKATVKSEDLNEPRGLAVTSDGTILVCCRGSDRVSIIAPGTQEVRPLIFEDVKKPFSILVCEKQKKIYVCEDEKSKDRNYFKIFDFDM